jgi:hypothetical protein
MHPLIAVLNAVRFSIERNRDGQNLVDVVSVVVGMRSNINTVAT